MASRRRTPSSREPPAEVDYLVERRSISGRRVDGERWHGERHAFEAGVQLPSLLDAVLERQIRSVATDDAIPADVCVHVALNDTQVGDVGDRLESGLPPKTLERGLRDDRDAAAQQHSEHVEEERQGALRQRVARRGLERAPSACTMPSLIASLLITGQGSASPIACASVVLPDPGGPLTTISVGGMRSTLPRRTSTGQAATSWVSARRPAPSPLTTSVCG
jgi:hypothetical protein